MSNKVVTFQGSRVPNTFNGFGTPITPTNENIILTPNVITYITIPGYSSGGFTLSYSVNKYIAIVNTTYNGTVWVANNSAPAIPTTTLTENGSQLIIPGYARHVSAGDILGFITADSATAINVQLYGVDN